MQRREFQFVSGTSRKFWTVESTGTTQTVRFGRIGTAGQEQAKQFATAAAAERACENLIAEKVKKGYVEVPGLATAAGAGKAVEEPEPAKADHAIKAAPAAAPPAERVIEFTPEEFDWRSHKFTEVTRKPRPAPAPFDLQSCLRRLYKKEKGWSPTWLWQTDEFPDWMTPQEAHFWTEAMFIEEGMSWTARESPGKVRAKLEDMTFTGKVKPDEFVARVDAVFGNSRPYGLAQTMHCLFSPEQMAEFYGRKWWLGESLPDTFRRVILPTLGEREAETYRKLLRPHLDPALWPEGYSDPPPASFRIALDLGMFEELRPVVLSWPDKARGARDLHYPGIEDFVYRFPDDAFVIQQVRRLEIPLHSLDDLRDWIALARFDGLDYARDEILTQTNQKHTADLIGVLGKVKAPETAEHMLALKLFSRAPKAARDWLDENPALAIPGLVPVVAGGGLRAKLVGPAIESLREAKKKGHEGLICEAVAAALPEAAQRVRRDVLEYREKVYPPLDDATTPKALKSAFAKEAKETTEPPAALARLGTLPPVLVGERRLNDGQVAALVGALRRSTLKEPSPLFGALKEHASRDSLDAFALQLFEWWLGEGAPPKERWAILALGHLGNDATALRLTPLVRNWPGENQHARAVLGLECLRAIGSDTALVCLNGIAQKLKFKGLKAKAAEFMEDVARKRGMTRTELEDRIVPDLDLDERGSRVFDFGPRQFRFVLGPDLKPMVKDDQGKLKPDLPAPSAKDEAAKAKSAVEEWKLLKKQLRETAKVQAERLEQAMVTGRRWTPAEFQALLVRHPLMINLVRLLLWGGYDAAGKLAATFRVTEEQTPADEKDEAFDLAGSKKIAHVGVVHPLHLGESQRSAWGAIFADYEIVPPFPQLARPVYRLEKGEVKEKEITRFAGPRGAKIPPAALVGTLERLAWNRGTPGDAGVFEDHSKPFPGANVTAVVQYYGVPIGMMAAGEDQQIDRCFFVRGLKTPGAYFARKEAVPLGKVDPVAVSEVLKDLAVIVAKGK